jgi:hypothetical protein
MVDLNRKIRATQARQGGFSSHVLPGAVPYVQPESAWQLYFTQQPTQIATGPSKIRYTHPYDLIGAGNVGDSLADVRSFGFPAAISFLPDGGPFSQSAIQGSEIEWQIAKRSTVASTVYLPIKGALDAFTIEFDIYPTDGRGVFDVQLFLQKDENPSSFFSFRFFTRALDSADRLEVRADTESANILFSSDLHGFGTVTTAAAQWSQVACTIQGSSVLIFVNGSLAGSFTMSQALSSAVYRPFYRAILDARDVQNNTQFVYAVKASATLLSLGAKRTATYTPGPLV